MRALVFEGKIIQIEAREFPVAPALGWIDIAAVTPPPKVGWSYDGTVFAAPPPPPPLPARGAIIDAEIAGSEALAGLIGEVAQIRGVTEARVVSDIKTRRGA